MNTNVVNGTLRMYQPIAVREFFFLYIEYRLTKALISQKFRLKVRRCIAVIFFFFVLQNEKRVKTNLFTIIHSDLTDNYFVTPHSTHAYTHVCRTQEMDEE